MNRLKPVSKWLAIVFCILGCEIFLFSLYLILTFRTYGNVIGTAPWDSFRSKLGISFVCLGLSAACLAFYRFGSQLRRLKPFFKWLAIGFGAFTVVLISFLLGENIRGRIALRSYMGQLRAQGEKLMLAEFDLPKSASKENGVAAWVALTNQFDALRKDCPFYPDANTIARIRLVAPGRAIVRCEQPDLGVNRTPVSHEVQAHPGRGRPGREIEEGEASFRVPVKADWADLDAQVIRASNVLENVRTALRRPALNVEIDYAQGFDIRLPHLQATRAAANWLALAGLSEIHHRNLDAATQNIVALAGLTYFGQDERLIISQIRRWQTGLTGLNLTWEALQRADWTDEQLLALQQAWRESVVVQNTASLEMERLFYRNSFERTRQLLGWSALRTNLFYYGRGEPVPSDLSEFFSDLRDGLHAFTWRFAWLDQDELRFLRRYQLMLDRARNAIARRDWSAFGQSDKDFASVRSLYDRMRFLLSDTFILPIETTLRRPFEYETQREMTVAAIGIKRYQLRTGKLPPEVAALVPDYLPRLPHDWMDGKPLRYRINPDDTFTLYSVGVDGRDDGGDATPIEGKRAYSIWGERDAVWPLPASPEEVAAAQPRR